MVHLILKVNQGKQNLMPSTKLPVFERLLEIILREGISCT